jgi:hypothetical protein
MESGLKWLEAIVTVVFDLEEGQLPDLIIPEGYGTEKDRKIISYNSFPDSYTINLEGQTVYSFYLRKGTRIANEDSKDGPYDIIHCYACFNQKKDPSNARGFFQKSVVFLTKTKLYNFFKGLFEDIARAYFQTGSDDLLREVYKTMNNEWPQPDQIPDFHEVSLLGKKYQVVFCYEIKSEKNFSYKSRLNQEPSPKRGLFTPDNLSRHDDEEAPLSMKKELSTPARINHLGDDMELPAQRKTSIGLCDDFKNINLFQLMGRQRICLILKLWETVMLNESLLILADSPLVCR